MIRTKFNLDVEEQEEYMNRVDETIDPISDIVPEDQLCNIEFDAPFQDLFVPHRYKVYYGGRGGAKSWSFARALLLLGTQKKLTILCARETQVSLDNSVMLLLQTQITDLGLTYFYKVRRSHIEGINGTLFLFKGLRTEINAIRSIEGIDICWVEEAVTVSERSWEILIPTIRKPGSEIWMSFNPDQEDDPTYKRFVQNCPPDCVCRKVNWRDNSWFPSVLRDEMEYMKRTDPENYAHVWEGETRVISDAIIFHGKCEVCSFEVPRSVNMFYYGVDWGFSQDPTVLIRCYLYDECLWIRNEAYAIGCDLDKIPFLFDQVPGARFWTLKADNSRPETISYIRKENFDIRAAKKWPGSVEDGIMFLRSFRKIYIHDSCRHMALEARLYKFKIHERTQEITSIPEDKNNHCWDAVRYALVHHISKAGQMRSLGAKPPGY